jgi:hypothetical protein
MKQKYTYILVATVCITMGIVPLYAQPFGGGIKGGIALTQLDGDAWGGYHKAAPTIGIFSYTEIGKQWLVSGGIEYMEKGSVANKQTPGVYYESRLQYVQMPAWLTYQFASRWGLDMGLSIGYLKSGEEDKDGFGLVPANPAFNQWEFSGIAGLNFAFTQRWVGELRFHYSVFPVRSHPGDQTYYLNRGQYNNVLAVSVRYLLATVNDL